MNPISKMIPGLRRPTELEKRIIAEQWRIGVGLGYLRFMKTCGLVLMVLCGILLLGCMAKGSEGVAASLTMGICTGFFAVLFMLMSSRVNRTKRYQIILAQGDFLVAQAVCTSCFVLRGNRHHVGHATVELPNGQKYSDVRMPYKTVKQMKRNGKYPVLLVQMANESILLAFTMQ